MPAFSVICLSISTAIIWELAFNLLTRRTITIGDGNAALMGLVFAMLVPATMPWWAVITGTFLTIVIGKQIFGGIGSNAFHPVALAIAEKLTAPAMMEKMEGLLKLTDQLPGLAAIRVVSRRGAWAMLAVIRKVASARPMAPRWRLAASRAGECRPLGEAARCCAHA